MASNNCVIIPQVLNKEGKSVDSKLFTDLLNSGLSREQAKRVYINSKSNFNETELLDYDENNELTVESALKSFDTTLNREIEQSKKDDVDAFGVAEFSNNFNNKTAKQVLDKIIPELRSKVLRQAAQVLLDNVDKIDFVKFNLSALLEKKVPGQYNANTGQILLNSRIIKDTDKLDYYETIIHELVHAYTVSALDKPKTPAEIQFSNEIRRIYEHLKSSTMLDRYGFKDHYEFVAELASNRSFIAELSKKKPSIVGKIIDAIAKLLGIKRGIKVSPEIEYIRNSIFGFINASNPNLVVGTPRVLNTTKSPTINTNNRRKSLEDSINDNINREIQETGKQIKDKQIFLLRTHQKISNTISKINFEIKKLNKEEATLKYEHNKRVQKIIDDYIVYNGGVYDTGYKNSPLYKQEILDFENTNNVDKIAELKNTKNTLSRILIDLNTDRISEHSLQYLEYSVNELNKIKNYDYDLDSHEDQQKLSEDFNFIKMILDYNDISEGVYSNIKSIADDVEKVVYTKIREYVGKLTDQYLDSSGLDEKINLDFLENDTQDIDRLTQLFIGFGDYAKTETQLIHKIVIDGKEKARLKTLKHSQKTLALTAELIKWGKKNGYTRFTGVKNKGSISKVYKLLCEISNTGRLDLVKPYTVKYYKDYNRYMRIRYDSSSSKEEIREASLWIKNNHYKYTKPEARYNNPKYQFINAPGNEALADFYNHFKESVASVMEKLPDNINKNNEEKIPSIIRDGVSAYLNANSFSHNGIGKSLWLALKTLLLPKSEKIMFDEDGNPKNRFSSKEVGQDVVKLRMVSEVDAYDKSTDLGTIINEFVSFGNDYEEMTKALPKVRMIQSIAANKRYTDSDGDKELGQTKDSRTYKSIDMYISKKVISSPKKKYLKIGSNDILDNDGNVVGVKNYYADDYIRGFIRYIQLLRLGFNPFSAANNIIVGMLNNIEEASGGQHFKLKHLYKAFNMYTYNNNLISKKVSKVDSNMTKIALLFDLVQPLDEIPEFEVRDKIKERSDNVIANLADTFKENAFRMQSAGEHMLQTITMIAYLMNKKTDSGKSYWDSTSVENGALVFEGDDTKQKIADSRETIRSINRLNHGNYSADNSSVYVDALWYQSILVFRRWLPYIIRNKFQKRHYNAITGQWEEGMFRAGGRGIVKGFQNMYIGTYNSLFAATDALKDKKTITKEEFIGLRKMLSNAVVFIALMGLRKFLAPPDEEDPDAWNFSYWNSKEEFNDFGEEHQILSFLLKSMMDTANVTSGDVTQFYNFFSYTKLVTKHALLTQTFNIANAMRTWGKYLFNDDESITHKRSGARKGEPIVIKATTDLIPYINQLDRVRTQGNKTWNEVEDNRLPWQ